LETVLANLVDHNESKEYRDLYIVVVSKFPQSAPPENKMRRGTYSNVRDNKSSGIKRARQEAVDSVEQEQNDA
jgi:hypothetical protein